jgi:hypothetical protein
LAPAKERAAMIEGAKSLGAAIGFDPLKEVLPRLGPDWGLCVMPAVDAKQLPQAIAALAIQPGPKEAPVDQTLYRGMQFFLGLAILDYNRKNKDQFQVRTELQGNVEVKFIANDQLFPPAFQPAFALKEGYLLLATSPAAIAQFQRRAAPPTASDEVPLLRISATELAKLLRAQRDRLIVHLAEKHQQSKEAAAQGLDSLLAVLDAFQEATLSHRAGADHVSWIFRIQMAGARP